MNFCVSVVFFLWRNFPKGDEHEKVYVKFYMRCHNPNFENFSLGEEKRMLEFYHVLTVCIPHARKCLKQVWIMQINDNYPRLVYKVMCLSSSRTDSINFHERTRTMNLMSPLPYKNLVRRVNLPVNYAGQIYFGDFRYWAFAVCLNF